MGTSPFGAARLSRRLTLEQAAERANMDVDAVKSLEDNCVYRFGSNADALAAALVYAAALRISEREARQLAGLPVPPRHLEASMIRRAVAVACFAIACFALAWFLRPEVFPEERAAPQVVTRPAAQQLPPRWEIEVDVYNGTRLGNAAAGLANEIAGLAYRIGAVRRAKRTNYRHTRGHHP